MDDAHLQHCVELNICSFHSFQGKVLRLGKSKRSQGVYVVNNSGLDGTDVKGRVSDVSKLHKPGTELAGLAKRGL